VRPRPHPPRSPCRRPSSTPAALSALGPCAPCGSTAPKPSGGPSRRYTILYNKFFSVIKFEVQPKTIKGPEVLGASGVFDDFEFEGDQEVVLADLYQFNLACTVYSAMLENVTSEQASRMTAMDSATNNAQEAGSKLQILYNRLRQAKITTELTEIVAGAESV
jgi:ATP synthase F1 gamma subunit